MKKKAKKFLKIFIPGFATLLVAYIFITAILHPAGRWVFAAVYMGFIWHLAYFREIYREAGATHLFNILFSSSMIFSLVYMGYPVLATFFSVINLYSWVKRKEVLAHNNKAKNKESEMMKEILEKLKNAEDLLNN